jgi:TetR/AcrR family transcriptional regulator
MGAPSRALASSPAKRPVVRRRLPAEDRRRQLIHQAIDQFAKHGFKGTRTKDIAAACGVSEAILFRHFATKEDLYQAILDSQIAESGEWLENMKRLAALSDDAGLVYSLVDRMLTSFRQDASFHRLMCYARLEGHALADIFHERMGLPTFGFLRDYIARRQREGAFREGDPRLMVLFLFAPALHYAQTKYVFGMGLLPGSDRDAARQLSRLALVGLRAPAKRNRKSRTKD